MIVHIVVVFVVLIILAFYFREHLGPLIKRWKPASGGAGGTGKRVAWKTATAVFVALFVSAAIFSFLKWRQVNPTGDTVVPAHGVAYIYPEGHRCVDKEPVYQEDRKFLTPGQLGVDPQGRMAVVVTSTADYEIPLVVKHHDTYINGTCADVIVGSPKWSRETT